MIYFFTSAAVALIALMIERFFGYPDWLYRSIKHPVVWMGALISFLDKKLNQTHFAHHTRKAFGIVALVVLISVTLAISLSITLLLRAVPGGFLLEAILATTMLAQKSLADYVQAVADALGQSLGEARQAVAHIVGRDPAELTESDVAKAAVESLAENTSDGITAPLFWMVLFGLPGAALYKAINTADSMIGYKNDKYQDFGWASARLDDLVNLPASRLTGYLFVLVGRVSKLDWRGGLTAMKRDARRHASPNAGWPESAMAGVLAISLGGPRSYQGKVLDLPTMGDGRKDLTRDDITRALEVYRGFLNSLIVLTAFVLSLTAAFWLSF